METCAQMSTETVYVMQTFQLTFKQVGWYDCFYLFQIGRLALSSKCLCNFCIYYIDSLLHLHSLMLFLRFPCCCCDFSCNIHRA